MACLRDTATSWAISTVFANLPEQWLDRWLVEECYNNDTGILKINDLDGLLAELDL